jgi:hypothetical protein
VTRKPAKPLTAEVQAAHLARLAWWCAFVLTVTFVAALWLVRSAGAAPLPVAASASPANLPAGPVIEFEVEGEEGEEEADDLCEMLEPEDAEEAETVECEEEGEEEVSPDCLISSAEATVAAVPGRDQVRLAVRYKALQASVVAVELKLRGGKGTLDLGAATERFHRAGVLRQSTVLSDAQMARVEAAREFTVGIEAVNTPKYCRGLFDRHLTVRHAAGSGLTWSDPMVASRR